MAKYNFFISYSRRDGTEIAQLITSLLNQKGYSVWMDNYELRAGDSWRNRIANAIANCDCFLPIITTKYILSKWVRQELEFALSFSKDRAKIILPLFCTKEQLPIELDYFLFPFQQRKAENEQDIIAFVDEIEFAYGYKLKTEVLYEKLTEYKRIGNENKTAETLCELIEKTCQKWENLAVAPSRQQELFKLSKELLRLYTELEKYAGNYDIESRKTAHAIIDTLDKVNDFLRAPKNSLFTKHLYFAAVAVRLVYFDREIRKECADILTNGDAAFSCPLAQFAEKQRLFVQAYYGLLQKENEYKFENGFSESDFAFITETENFILENKKQETTTPAPQKHRQTEILSETDEILVSVARFMQEGNKLFDVLQKKGIAGDFLSCLLTSYERLKNYCEVVGAKNVAADCIDRIVEIRNAIDKSNTDSPSDEKIENGIKSLLGFTLKGSGDYDVFISFKSEDADLAEKIYNLCQRNLKVPFWSKRTLPQLSKSEYEDAIYNALRKSKHFVIVLSRLEYLQANWIKREMAAFDRAITEGRKRNANFVFVVTDNVYNEIIDSNKMCLDERYCGYQIIKMSEYEETLMQYIT